MKLTEPKVELWSDVGVSFASHIVFLGLLLATNYGCSASMEANAAQRCSQGAALVLCSVL